MDNFDNQFLETLDCFDPELRPFIPYLLQDLWEIGSSSEKILNVIIKNKLHENHLRILDIGCGKGAITIPIAKELNAEVFGIDAMPEFIDDAKTKAKEYGVEKLCSFIHGDAVKLLPELKDFNLALLASVGPVLGDVSQTLANLEKCLVTGGHVILDDCYLPDEAISNYTRCQRETEFFKQIRESNYSVIDTVTQSPDETADTDDYIYKKIEMRVNELSGKYPEKKNLFENYLAAQKKENYSLENELQCVTILLKKK
jgi:ubiquinone/menaquinone biosynthesis C-methylase UbiE